MGCSAALQSCSQDTTDRRDMFRTNTDHSCSSNFPIISNLPNDLQGIKTHKTGLYANSQNAIPGKTISTRPQRGATPLFCVYTFTLSCFGYFWQLFQGKISIPSHLGSSCLSSPLVMGYTELPSQISPRIST